MVVLPVSDNFIEIEGTGRTKCSECDIECYLAPSSYPILAKNPNMIKICIPCAASQIMKRLSNGTIKWSKLNQQQKDEVLSMWSKLGRGYG